MQIGNTLGKLTSSRGGAVVLGIIAAILAAVLLAVYVTHYRDSVKSDNAQVNALQVQGLIPKGTPGTLVAKQHNYVVAPVAKDTADRTGAIADPNALVGRIAVADLYPGHTITAADFTSEVSTAINTQLTGPERAITLSVDGTRGSLANVATGDHVDIYQQLSGPQGTIVKLFRPNVVVLSAPGAGGGNVVLRVTTKDVPDFLFAASNTTLAFAVRPASRPGPTVPTVADFQNMLKFTAPH